MCALYNSFLLTFLEILFSVHISTSKDKFAVKSNDTVTIQCNMSTIYKGKCAYELAKRYLDPSKVRIHIYLWCREPLGIYK